MEAFILWRFSPEKICNGYVFFDLIASIGRDRRDRRTKVLSESVALREEGTEMDKEQFKALQKQLTRFERQVGMNHGGLAVLIEQLQAITKLLIAINETLNRNAKKSVKK